MRVGVVTPYYRESLEPLHHCHESVRGQTHACTHFMVADGFPNADIPGWDVQHIVLPKWHGDVGNTPRGIGAISAVNQWFDAIALLDADNWYYPQYIESMIGLHQKQDGVNQVSIITSTAERQAAIEFAKAAAMRPEIVGVALQKISQDAEISKTMLEILETQNIIDGKAEITLVPRGQGILGEILAAQATASTSATPPKLQ